MSLKKRLIDSHIFDANYPGVHIAFNNLIYQQKRISVGDGLFNFVNIHHRRNSFLQLQACAGFIPRGYHIFQVKIFVGYPVRLRQGRSLRDQAGFTNRSFTGTIY